MKINRAKGEFLNYTYLFLIVCSTLFISNQPLFSQQLTFDEVHAPEGNSFEFVTGIQQDSLGNMWFGTKTGMYIYDGHGYRNYKFDFENPNSLNSNLIESFILDSDKKVWIGTLGFGLNLLDIESGHFTHYTHDPDNPNSISNDTIAHILKDSKGRIWIGTHGGLDLYNPQTNDFQHYRHDPKDPSSLSYNQVRSLYEDSQGTLWVGTGSPYADNGGGERDGGLNKMDMENRTFVRFKHDPDNINSLLDDKVTSIFEDDQGMILVGTRKFGLHRVNPETNKIERLIYDIEKPGELGSPSGILPELDFDHITCITQDSRGNYWFGTAETGIFNLNREHSELVHFSSNDSTQNFSDRGVWTASTSRDGILWLGGTRGFIYRVNPNKKEVPFFKITTGVNRLMEGNNEDLWIISNKNIVIKDLNNELKEPLIFDFTEGKSENENKYNRVIYKDNSDEIWIGGGFGLKKWIQSENNFITYVHDPQVESSISHSDVPTIFEDSDNNFWVGTTHGLNLMNREDGTFTRYMLNDADSSFIGRNIVSSINEDKYGNTWVGHWNGAGLFKFDYNLNDKKRYLLGTNIVSVYKDTFDDLWVGTTDGLYKYYEEDDVFHRFIDPIAKTDFSNIEAILEDHNNNLWFSTNANYKRKLVRINESRTETSSLIMQSKYDQFWFEWNSASRGQDNNLYFGTNQGYYNFNPETIFEENLKPEISIFNILVAEKKVELKESNSSRDRNLNTKEIYLDFNQNVFSLEYNIFDYVNPDENRLFYFLENYDKQWQKSDFERKAYYFNIPPGKYSFRVRGSNSSGVWNEERVNIIILPPWWKSWWAYGLYALLFALLIYSYDKFQRRRLTQKAKLEAKEKELQQAKEIQKAYTELKATQAQLIHSEKMASLGELTAGIAHEIQNPLNFIINFSEVNGELIEELLEEMEEGNMDEVKEISLDISQNEKKIMHHGKRADAIVKNMLQHSRGGNDDQMLTDINALADEYLRLSYHGLRAKDKSFNADFKTDLDNNLPKIKVVPQDIGRVFLNLINNAFYAVSEKSSSNSDEKYKPLVTVSTKNLENTVEICVKDNGGGIPENIRDKIFQPFFTTKSAGDGTGLGLSLSFEIISKGHSGNLNVKTVEGEGTEFIISLPKA